MEVPPTITLHALSEKQVQDAVDRAARESLEVARVYGQPLEERGKLALRTKLTSIVSGTLAGLGVPS